MIIKQLHLRDFRNYEKLDLSLHPNLNIIIGNNGAGKTNILESLVVTSNTKSFRSPEDRDLIAKEKTYSRIDVVADEVLRVVIHVAGKRLFVDQTMIKKTSDFIGRVNCILFKPSDLEIFDQSPKERRKLMDIEIGKIKPKYLHALVAYSKLLKDKNHLLKEEKLNEALLEVLEESMIPHIGIILKERNAFLSFINEHIEEEYCLLSGEKRKISLVYKKCAEEERESIVEMIRKNHHKDLLYHYTVAGPQKDDIAFLMDGYPVESYASQGQKRMILIAFKFSLIRYIISITRETPVILLDDILSELDLQNRERLLKRMEDQGQTIITTTDTLGMNITIPHQTIEIKEGKLYGIYNN